MQYRNAAEKKNRRCIWMPRWWTACITERWTVYVREYSGLRNFRIFGLSINVMKLSALNCWFRHQRTSWWRFWYKIWEIHSIENYTKSRAENRIIDVQRRKERGDLKRRCLLLTKNLLARGGWGADALRPKSFRCLWLEEMERMEEWLQRIVPNIARKIYRRHSNGQVSVESWVFNGTGSGLVLSSAEVLILQTLPIYKQERDAGSSY